MTQTEITSLSASPAHR